MPQELKIRPSSLQRVVACLGSLKAEAPFPFTDSPAAARGRALHSAIALLFQAGEKAKAAILKNPAIKAEDMQDIQQAYQWGRELLPADPDVQILCEQELDLSFLNISNGHPDIVFVSPKYEGAVLTDWKFGKGAVEDPEKNAQLWAYAAGLLVKFKFLKTVEATIIQPGAWKKDDAVRSHVFDAESLRVLAKKIKAVAQDAKAENAPRAAGEEQCKWCKAKGTCPEYAAFAEGKAEIKQAALETALVTVQAGGVEIEPDEPIQMPVVVINAQTLALVQEKKALALSMRVVDKATADAAGLMSKDMRALSSLIEKGRKQITDSIYKFFKKAVAAAEPALTSLKEGDDFLQAQTNAWMKSELEKAEAARREQEKLRIEAEKKETKARRAEAKRAAEAEAANRAALEAQQRAEQAKGKAAKEKAQREAAELALKASEAENKRLIEEEKRNKAERDAATAQAAAEAVKEPEKVAGFRTQDVAKATIPDFSLVPKALMEVVLLPNQKVIDQMVKTGALNEAKHGAWLKIVRTQEQVRSR